MCGYHDTMVGSGSSGDGGEEGFRGRKRQPRNGSAAGDRCGRSGGRRRPEPPGEAAPEEWTPCPTCGTHTGRKNLKRHLKKHEKKRAKMKEGEKKAGGPRPGRKPGPRNPALSDFSDEELFSRVAAINRELTTLVPGSTRRGWPRSQARSAVWLGNSGHAKPLGFRGSGVVGTEARARCGTTEGARGNQTHEAAMARVSASCARVPGMDANQYLGPDVADEETLAATTPA
jgi:hypothetical protein